MIEEEKFVESIQALLSAGQSEKEVNEYIQKFGFSEKEANEFIAKAQKGKSESDRQLMKMMPSTMEDQMKRLATQKNDNKKELFKQNIDEMSKIMSRIQQDRKAEEDEKK